jgi:dihydrofolate synthase/folylpolyglutamate synthase
VTGGPATPGAGSPLDAWLAHVSVQHPAQIALGLDRVRDVLGRMALAAPRVVFTVGGTNGKGSTCSYLESILRAAGYRTGLYTSPHLIRYNERVHLSGVEVADDVLARAFHRVERAREATPLTYFEFGTLAALATFEEFQVDVAVLEVGLGGRLDAVNVLDADCAIVTTVDLDHQAWLGTTREEIALEKAHIFRAGRPALFGDGDPPASLVGHARAIGANLQMLGRDFRAIRHEGQWDFEGRRGVRRALPMPALRGPWQLANAATALAALDEVADRLPVSLGEVKRGLAGVRLQGRQQVLPGRPAVVLDVAHNPHAARALAAGLGEMPFAESTIAVFAMLADKDIGAVIDAIAPRIDHWHVASVGSERAASAEQMAGLLAERGLAGRTRTFASVPLAFEAAMNRAGPNDRIVAFGSFLTVAAVLERLR